MIAIGIDIGLTGALAVVDHRGVAQLHDLPVVADGAPRMRKTKKGDSVERQPMRLCGRELRALLRRAIPAGETAIVLFEDVQARPQGNGNSHGNTMHSQGSLMRSRGLVEGVLDGLSGIEVKAVQPQAWKRWYDLMRKKGEDGKPESDSVYKGRSLEMARRLYPGAASALKRALDHNRAEALLIAHYGLRNLT